MKVKKIHKKYEYLNSEGRPNLYLLEIENTCFDLNEIKQIDYSLLKSLQKVKND